MGQQIIKQPDGKYAVWSAIVNDFILLDATPEEIVEAWTDEFRQNAINTVSETVRILNMGGKPYLQFTKTWDEAVALKDALNALEAGRTDSDAGEGVASSKR